MEIKYANLKKKPILKDEKVAPLEFAVYNSGNLALQGRVSKKIVR